MKRVLGSLLLAFTLITAVAIPKKAEAGLIVSAIGAGSGNSGTMSSGIVIMIIGAIMGNATVIVFDHKNEHANAFADAIAKQFPYLQDQPTVIKAISSTIKDKVKNLSADTESAEIKLSDEEISSILDLAILDEAQAQDLAVALQ